MTGALIITAEIAPRDFTWLNELRRAHYPAHRNQVPAHLTMFRTLPPSSEGEVRSTLSRLLHESVPRVSIEGLMDLGGGSAFRIVSPDLERIRGDLAGYFHGLLGIQDSCGWKPHVTIQNKVSVEDARNLLRTLRKDFRPRPLAITGLELHRYSGGPWERLGTYRFGSH